MTWLLLFTLCTCLAVASLVGMAYASPAQQAVAPVVAGTYSGNVIVTEPAPLGALSLVLGVQANGNALTGQVDAVQTLVFLGGPSVTGSVTASAGVTPTLQIDSEVFTDIVSGRTVRRQFILTGVVLNEGNTLRGDYRETITGFTPEPMVVKGTFLLVRPSGSQVIITPPNGNTPTPTPVTPGPVPPTATPTATATPPGNGGSGSNRLMLPIIMQSRG
ncbi:MAG TPA: hypothetical protein PKE45_12980 [Caldilineaceae bacterium]|nr:hypothetical protein [Caldilineaceae bacterium]